MIFNNIYPIISDKKIDVTLVGEVLVDLIKDQDSNQVTKHFGGSPANIALNLKRLGQKAKLFCAAGNDSYGDFLQNQLDQFGIDYSLARVSQDTSYVEINKSPSGPTPTFHRFSDYYIEDSVELSNAVANSKIFHFSYWPISMAVSRDLILKLIKIAKKNKTVIGFDPNYHILLDNSQSNGLQSLIEVIHYVDIIKPSLDDAERIFGEGYTVIEYIDKFLKLGCKLVVMTLGEKGLIAKYQGETVSLPSKATFVIDSTGAGDAFWSGLYAGITDSLSIEKSIELGLLCSAYNLRVIGADSNLPHLTTLKEEL